jgi:hypothetical protein
VAHQRRQARWLTGIARARRGRRAGLRAAAVAAIHCRDRAKRWRPSTRVETRLHLLPPEIDGADAATWLWRGLIDQADRVPEMDVDAARVAHGMMRQMNMN